MCPVPRAPEPTDTRIINKKLGIQEYKDRGGVAQCEDLDLSPSTTKKQKQKQKS